MRGLKLDQRDEGPAQIRCANEVNPDEGIETASSSRSLPDRSCANEVNPDEGIETSTGGSSGISIVCANEVNPDEGIETLCLGRLLRQRLEGANEVNPDEGIETTMSRRARSMARVRMK